MLQACSDVCERKFAMKKKLMLAATVLAVMTVCAACKSVDDVQSDVNSLVDKGQSVVSDVVSKAKDEVSEMASDAKDMVSNAESNMNDAVSDIVSDAKE